MLPNKNTNTTLHPSCDTSNTTKSNFQFEEKQKSKTMLCYIGKATKIFIGVVVVAVIVGLILGLAVFRHGAQKAHSCNDSANCGRPIGPNPIPAATTAANFSPPSPPTSGGTTLPYDYPPPVGNSETPPAPEVNRPSPSNPVEVNSPPPQPAPVAVTPPAPVAVAPPAPVAPDVGDGPSSSPSPPSNGSKALGPTTS